MIEYCARAEGGCGSVSKGVEMICRFWSGRATTTRCLIIMVMGRWRGGDDVGEITGRMAFHFVMVLVGLLEASIAAKREQDYLLPTHRVEALVDGVPFFSFLLNFYYKLQLLTEFFLIVFISFQYLY